MPPQIAIHRTARACNSVPMELIKRPLVASPRFMGVGVLVCALVCAVACATAPSSTKAGVLHSRDYFPLAIGNAWTYRMTPSPAEKELDEVRIIDMDAQGFFIDNHGTRFAPRTDGIFDGQRFLLQEPLAEGRTWMAVPSIGEVERFRIVAVDRRTTVEAGTFQDCVEVEATSEKTGPGGKPMTLRMVWTFAPHVGLVLLEHKIVEGQAPPRTTARMELVRFTPAPEKSPPQAP